MLLLKGRPLLFRLCIGPLLKFTVVPHAMVVKGSIDVKHSLEKHCKAQHHVLIQF